MKIPPDKIDEIKSANDIVDVIGSYVKLIRKGRNYLGLCPFHQEKTPSFTVSPDKQMFYCFGCHTGGNVFSFLQQYDKLSFVDSVTRLAERAGIPLIMQEETLEKDKERESLFNLNKLVADYFNQNINVDIGRIGKDYFINRGISEETIEKFSLGYSINSWEGLVNQAKKLDMDFNELHKLGLLGKREDGSYFDSFRGRIMFPITNTFGKIVGFGGRKLFENDDSGKYINSKESEIYNKSKTLYGLSFGKEDIRRNDYAILVEGYMDFLTLFQNGVKNVVASSGTALTQDQVKILSRYTKNLLFIYDADMAGMKATIRGLDVILENDFDVKIVSLENNEDPDSFVRKFGVDKFKYSLDNSISFIKFMAETYRKLGKMSSAVEQVKSVREMLALLSKVKDKLKLEFYLKEVAEWFDINEGRVRVEFDNLFKKESKRRQQFTPVDQSAEKRSPAISIDTTVILPSAEEQEIIALAVMEGRKIIDFVKENLADVEIESPLTKKILEGISALIDQNIPLDMDILLSTFDDVNIRGLISKLYLEKKIVSNEEVIGKYEDLESSRIKWIKDIIKKIKIKIIDQEMERVKKMIHKAESEGEDPSELMHHFTELHGRKIEWSKIE